MMKNVKNNFKLKYKWVDSFVDGLARVKSRGKYGIINQAGLLIVDCKYDCVYLFNEGLAKVKLGDKYGFINKLGE